MENRPTVYIETSVFSYLAARPSRDVIAHAHQMLTVEWWDRSLPRVEAFASAIVLEEASRGDPEAAVRRIRLIEQMDFLPTPPEVEALARTYIDANLIPESQLYDALHLAIASVHAIDYLLTWNCKHIAAATVRRGLAAINIREGFGIPVLCTPEELLEF
jgi:predicted nucleic acid-binding protein